MPIGTGGGVAPRGRFSAPPRTVIPNDCSTFEGGHVDLVAPTRTDQVWGLDYRGIVLGRLNAASIRCRCGFGGTRRFALPALSIVRGTHALLPCQGPNHEGAVGG